MTTIAWQLQHITHGHHIYWEHSFGPATRNFDDLPIFGSAAAACADLTSSQDRVTETLAALDDTALGRPIPTHFGEPWPAAQVFEVLLVEQVHHHAELSLLRDLSRVPPRCFLTDVATCCGRAGQVRNNTASNQVLAASRPPASSARSERPTALSAPYVALRAVRWSLPRRSIVT